jgi:hypothetical protein
LQNYVGIRIILHVVAVNALSWVETLRPLASCVVCGDWRGRVRRGGAVTDGAPVELDGLITAVDGMVMDIGRTEAAATIAGCDHPLNVATKTIFGAAPC